MASGYVLYNVFIILSILVVFDMTKSFDMAFYNFLMNFRCDILDNYFIFITKFGDIAFITGLVIGCLVVLRNKFAFLYSCLAVDCALTNKIVKHIIRRSRPDVLKLIKQGGFSFPSGHSMIAVCMYGYLIYTVNKRFTNKYLKFISIFMLVVLIISIGLSRVYVGVHYISDVIAGYILALILLILYIELTEKFINRGN